MIGEMQSWKLVPEAYLVEPGCDLPGVVKMRPNGGIRMFVVCGGEGTIYAIAGILADTDATLGIIPIGTRNNTALSLGTYRMIYQLPSPFFEQASASKWTLA